MNTALLDKWNSRLRGRDSRPIVIDGAVGTLLQSRGYRTRLPLWTAQANFDVPDQLRDIHLEYLNAGAEMVTTNTFRTTDWTFRKAGQVHRAHEATRIAVQLAREAADSVEKEVVVAGSIATLEDCYRPDLVPPDAILDKEHRKQLCRLKEAGVDCVLAETINTAREALCLARSARDISLPFMMSLVTDASGALLSGEPLDEVASALLEFEPMAILLNCRPLGILNPPLETLSTLGIPFGFYANGPGEPHDLLGWKLCGDQPVDSYAVFTRKWVENGAKIVGGCCGTTPAFIEAIATL